jgi:hypothetical protein
VSHRPFSFLNTFLPTLRLVPPGDAMIRMRTLVSRKTNSDFSFSNDGLRENRLELGATTFTHSQNRRNAFENP